MEGRAPLILRIALRSWRHAAVFLLACAVLLARRPEAVFHAQFYAEDGHVWFADAYNLGWWNALFRTQVGYFQTFSRLGAALALLAPLALAPLVLNLVGLAVQALPVNLLIGARSEGWGPLRFRALLAAAYVALPNLGEIGFGITNAQWLLALCAFLLLVAQPPRSWAGCIFDSAVILLSGLSGPFCIPLLPIAILAARKRRALWRWAPAGMLVLCGLVQAYALLVLDRTGRGHPPLGASPVLLVRILGGNVILGAIFGRIPVAAMPGKGVFILLLCAVAVGAFIAAGCLLKSTREMKLFLLLAGMLFAASLLSHTPIPAPGPAVWPLLATETAVRYWFFPSLAFAWSLVWCVRAGSPVLRAASVILLCAMCLGVVANWKLQRFKDLHFAESARAFDAAPPGTVVVIPENPDGWSIRLVKHSNR